MINFLFNWNKRKINKELPLKLFQKLYKRRLRLKKRLPLLRLLLRLKPRLPTVTLVRLPTNVPNNTLRNTRPLNVTKSDFKDKLRLKVLSTSQLNQN